MTVCCVSVLIGTIICDGVANGGGRELPLAESSKSTAVVHSISTVKSFGSAPFATGASAASATAAGAACSSAGVGAGCVCSGSSCADGRDTRVARVAPGSATGNAHARWWVVGGGWWGWLVGLVGGWWVGVGGGQVAGWQGLSCHRSTGRQHVSVWSTTRQWRAQTTRHQAPTDGRPRSNEGWIETVKAVISTVIREGKAVMRPVIWGWWGVKRG